MITVTAVHNYHSRVKTRKTTRNILILTQTCYYSGMFKYVMKKHYLHAAWAISLTATILSLYFSEIMKLPPCTLCWWQRIFMYPLSIIIPIGLLNKDENVHKYVLPLSIIGALIGGYQYLLTADIISEVLSPCTAGISCAKNVIVWFGFINIPLLSFTAFSGIILLMYLYSNHKINV